MARTQIPIQELAVNGGTDADLAWTAGDDVNEHYFLNTGREILLMRSVDGSKTATIVSVADEYGRTGDKTIAPAAGKYAAAGPFAPKLFGQTGADFGRVHVDLDDDTNVHFAVIRFNPADR